MEKYESINEILNDLVKINNDRIAGYQRAINESKDLDIDLKAIFESMIRESNQYKQELSDLIMKNGGAVEDETTSSGKIYRAWMDIKSTFTDTDRHSILESCEFGEDAAQRAYEAALASDLLLDDDTRKLVADEKASLQRSHDLIRHQRDAHKALQK
jgi:uncharacterized protein (TIGR02284 family)